MSRQKDTIIIRHECDDPNCELQGDLVLEVNGGYLVVVERGEIDPPEVHTNVCAHRVGHLIGAAATAAADIGCDEVEDQEDPTLPPEDALVN